MNLYLNNYDFICFSETHEKNPTASIKGKCYYFSRASFVEGRRGRPSGGLDIYSPPSLSTSILSSSEHHMSLCIENKLSLISVYYKPSLELDELFEDLLTALDNSKHLPIIIGGDFNLHYSSEDFEQLDSILNDFNISLVSDPSIITFIGNSSSTPDHIFASDSVKVLNVDVLSHSDSDHLPISVSVDFNHINAPPKTNSRSIFDAETCNSFLVSATPNIYNVKSDNVIKVVDVAFSSSISTRRNKSYAKWSNAEIRKGKLQLRKLLKFFRTHSDNMNEQNDVEKRINDELRVNFRSERSALNKLIKRAKKEFRENEAKKMIKLGAEKGIEALYKYAKPSADSLSTQIPLEEWRSFYSKLYQNHEKPTFQAPDFVASEKGSKLVSPFSIAEVVKAIESQSSKAPGLNNISPVDCKKVGTNLAPFLQLIYNDVITSQIKFPFDWLSSVFFFLHKKGNTRDPSNYRSIAVENPFLKIFMWLLNRRLTDYLENSNLLPEYQFGFRANHSAPSAVYLLNQAVAHSLDNKNKVFACFVDFQKAFDLVDRSLLMNKLLHLGVPPVFAGVIFDILSNLKMHVKSNDCLSSSFLSHNGVPQGDPLSPILFSLFIHDLPLCLKSRGVSLNGNFINHMLYADDLVIISTKPEELQEDLVALRNYCTLNRLKVNVEKTKCLPFYRGRYDIIPTFTYNGVQLENCKTFKYLGLTLTTQLSSSRHVDAIVSKCNARIGMLFHKLKISNLPLNLALKIFDVYITPIIEYGLPIWLPKLSESSYTKLNTVYSKFLKRFLCLPYCTHNSIVHYLLKTYPIVERMKNVHKSRFLSLKFPSLFNRNDFTLPQEYALTRQNVEGLPDFLHNIETIILPISPEKRRSLLYDKLDIIHYSICSYRSFHSISEIGKDECICKFCGLKADHFHHRDCFHLRNLSMKQIMIRAKANST